MKRLSLVLFGLGCAAGCANAANTPGPAAEVAVTTAKPAASLTATSVAPVETTPPEPVATTEAEAAPVPTPMSSCGLVATITKKADGNGYALTLKNTSKQTLKLVDAGDGSESGWRTPSIAWTGTQNGKPAKELEGGRCGMMNAIEKSEIFSIAPGASHSINQWIHGPLYAAGTYEVRLRYTNDPKKLARKSSPPPDVAALLAATSACEVTSAPLTIKVP